MRQVQQNVLSQAPSGAVAAVFPGGVQMPEVPGFPGTRTADPEQSLRWVSSGGSIRGLIYVQGDTTADHEMFLSAGPTPGANEVILQLGGDSSLGGKSVSATVTDPTIPVAGHFIQRTIINGLQQSSFLQLRNQFDTLANLQVQFFDITAFTSPVGTVIVTFNLPTAWPNNNFFLQVTLKEASGGGWGPVAGQPTDNARSTVFMANNPVVQNLMFSCMSIGN